MMSLRKSFSDTSAPRPEPKFHILLAHFSNSGSWVTPRSSVAASYLVRPGDLRAVDGSPPSRCAALECALPKQALQKRADVEPDLRPERLVIGLENHPLRGAVEGFFEKQRHAAHGNIFVFVAAIVLAVEGARAPYHVAVDRQC